MSKLFITVDQAIAVLPDSEYIHTIRNPYGVIIGCDIHRDTIIDILKENSDCIEIGGDQCRSMGHALVVHDGTYLFIEADENAVNAIDPIT